MKMNTKVINQLGREVYDILVAHSEEKLTRFNRMTVLKQEVVQEKLKPIVQQLSSAGLHYYYCEDGSTIHYTSLVMDATTFESNLKSDVFSRDLATRIQDVQNLLPQYLESVIKVLENRTYKCDDELGDWLEEPEYLRQKLYTYGMCDDAQCKALFKRLRNACMIYNKRIPKLERGVKVVS